jgi:hypothetical protein
MAGPNYVLGNGSTRPRTRKKPGVSECLRCAGMATLIRMLTMVTSAGENAYPGRSFQAALIGFQRPGHEGLRADWRQAGLPAIRGGWPDALH